MPELPEVESVRRQLAPELTGRRVEQVWADPHPAQRFTKVALLRGRRVLEVGRRGKYLVCPLDRELELVLHLGMTGSVRFDDADAYARARFTLEDGRQLVFRDPRRFGRVSVVPAGDYREVPLLAGLGPEPLSEDFDVAAFASLLRRTSAPVKTILLSQRAVAGVGNIYADESLWRARIHPRSRRVGASRARALHGAIREVLAAAIEHEGTTFRDYQLVNGQGGAYLDHLDVYGRGGQPCRRCGTVLQRAVVAQRGTTYCPRCQRT